MPVNIVWDNSDKTIIRMEYTGSWTWEELYAATAQSHVMLNEVEHKVDFVHYWVPGAHVPSNALVHSKNLIEKRHPKVNIVAIVGVNPLLKATWVAFSKVYATLTKRYTFILASSLDEARVMLAEAHAKELPR